MAEKTQSAQQVFDTGTNFLSEGKFAEAIDNYQAILKEGVSSADLEANLGRALVGSGQTGKGVAHVMNAISIDRFESRYRTDLKIAQSKVESGMGNHMAHPVEWGNRISAFLRPTEAASLGSFVLLGLATASAFRRKIKKSQTLALVALALLFFTLAGLGIYGRSVAIVMSATELKLAPLESAESIQSLPSGTRLRVIRKSGDFAEVERTGSFRGWIPSGTLSKSPF